MSGERGPVWQLHAGELRKIATRITHLSEWANVGIENRGQGYPFIQFEDADGALIRESLLPGEDA